jgi:hypothetical protein
MKTSKIIYKVSLMAIMSAPLLLTGCSDSFLDVTPPDKATLNEYYNSASHINEALVATYNPLRVYDYNKIQYAPLNLCSDVMADDIWVGGGGISDNQHMHKMANYESTANSSDALTGVWKESYVGIRDANDVITYLDNAKANLTTSEYNSMKEEAMVLRAFYYCQLWKFYGNVPYFTTNFTDSYAADQKKADEIYELVITDLESAIEINALPMRWDDYNAGRVNKAMAYMLYAEMVMYQNDTNRYSKALSYMQELISGGQFSLTPNYADIWKESGEFNSESIFEINYTDDQGARAWLWPWGAGGTVLPRLIGPQDWKGGDGVDTGWGFGPIRQETYDMFDKADTRRDATCYDARNANYTKRYEDTGFFQNKYLPRTENNKDQIADGDVNFNNNLRIYRYAETLLNAAELLVRTNGDMASAQNYLNLVHHRAGLTDNKAATIDNIIQERHLEFVGEGKRYWDLIRSGKAATVLTPDAYGYRTNTWSESKKYLPIPQTEIDASNGTLTQNNY